MVHDCVIVCVWLCVLESVHLIVKSTGNIYQEWFTCKPNAMLALLEVCCMQMGWFIVRVIGTVSRQPGLLGTQLSCVSAYADDWRRGLWECSSRVFLLKQTKRTKKTSVSAYANEANKKTIGCTPECKQLSYTAAI